MLSFLRQFVPVKPAQASYVLSDKITLDEVQRLST